MTHTPGPWKAEDHGEVEAHRGRMVTIRDSRNIHLATVDGLDASVRGQELPNARLIAAAPELLLALEQAAELLSDNTHAENCTDPACWELIVYNQVRDAIKAAKGKA